ncbi:hypothetical protein P7K49_010373, partial [Saguinus oedipus]
MPICSGENEIHDASLDTIDPIHLKIATIFALFLVRLLAHCSRLSRVPPLPLQTPAALSPESLTLAFFLITCIGSPVCPTVSDAAIDTSSKITTKDLKEKKEVVEEVENGRDAPANGNANEENGEQEADNEVDEEGGEEEEEEEEGV